LSIDHEKIKNIGPLLRKVREIRYNFNNVLPIGGIMLEMIITVIGGLILAGTLAHKTKSKKVRVPVRSKEKRKDH
jgi:hypothetical protein